MISSLKVVKKSLNKHAQGNIKNSSIKAALFLLFFVSRLTKKLNYFGSLFSFLNQQFSIAILSKKRLVVNNALKKFLSNIKHLQNIYK